MIRYLGYCIRNKPAWSLPAMSLLINTSFVQEDLKSTVIWHVVEIHVCNIKVTIIVYWHYRSVENNLINNNYIPLTNQIWGLYCKLPTEFFPPRIYGPLTLLGHKSKGKKQGSATYSTDQEDEVCKIFIMSILCVWRVRERFSFTRNGFKFLNLVESKTSQFEIVFKSLACFITQFWVKESF